MPNRLRETFAYILIFCSPADGNALWEEFRMEMSQDYLRTHSEDESLNLALNDINHLLLQLGSTLEAFNLPTPTVLIQPEEQLFDKKQQEEILSANLPKLNNEQRAAYDCITTAIDSSEESKSLFFIDGPGGSGKTFLIQTLLASVRAQGKIAISCASTGRYFIK